jgi:hypothetical protein
MDRRLRQSQQWRYEVGPQDAPPDRPAPPFQLRSMFVADFLKTQRDLIVIPSSASVGMGLVERGHGLADVMLSTLPALSYGAGFALKGSIYLQRKRLIS